MSTTLLNPYCTLEDVQKECENHDAEDSLVMLDAINAASRRIDSYCRRDFLWHDHSLTPFSVLDSMIVRETIYLPWPLAELSKIVIVTDGVEEIVDPKRYRASVDLQKSSTRIVLAGKWLGAVNLDLAGMTSGSIISLPPEVRIYGCFGYAVDGSATEVPSRSLPAGIRRACTVIAAVWSGKLRKQVQDFNGGSTTVTQKAIPQSVIDMLDDFRTSLT